MYEGDMIQYEQLNLQPNKLLHVTINITQVQGCGYLIKNGVYSDGIVQNCARVNPVNRAMDDFQFCDGNGQIYPKKLNTN